MTEERYVDPIMWAEVVSLAPDGEAQAFVTQLIGILTKVAPPIFIDIRAAIAAADAKALFLHVHRLKGCCANLGADVLASMLETVESAAAAGSCQQKAVSSTACATSMKKPHSRCKP